MSATCYLGVDGGGTKTRFVLIDAAGRVLAEVRRGTTYHPQVGLDGVRAILAHGIGEVLALAGADAGAIGHAFVGLPAHGEDSAVTPQLDAIPQALLGHDRYTCGNDMICGWAGSLACADGVNIVAGTGSIGYGQRQGAAARAGGWGEVLSDEGSAYWIAVQGLNACSRMSDGRLPRSPLLDAFAAHLGLAQELDLCARIHGPDALARDQVARLSLLVAQAAREGDTVATGIYRRAGEELALIVQAVRQALHFEDDEAIPVSYSGGAFSAGDLLLAPLSDALRTHGPAFVLQPPRFEPHYGAALYAMKLAGDPLPVSAPDP